VLGRALWSNARLIRWLRIGWVVLCFVPTLSLVVLWVRSYWSSDLIRTHISTKPLEIISTPGRVKITRSEGVSGQFATLATYSNGESVAQSLISHVERFKNIWGLGVVRGRNAAALLPYWLFVLIVGTISFGLARIRWSNRFSMRTIMITTTLVAIALGVLVVAMRGGR
jgi:hypothetical protein